MGWWPIDPNTGSPVEHQPSKLSRAPDSVLLNAVPGVDNDDSACYLGDGPLDMVSTLPSEITPIIDPAELSADEFRALFLQNEIPAGIDSDQAEELLEVVEAFWTDIDWCYDEDWSRRANAAERRWLCEDIVRRLKSPQA